MQVLPELTRRHEVVLWTDQEEVSPEVRAMARVEQYGADAPPWREINKGEISIYHLGNHPDLHGGIWRVSGQHPGITVLHDLRLHDFFYTLWVHYRNDRASYLAALERWYGGTGRRAGEAFCQGGISPAAMAQEFPLTREAVHGALGVVTHAGLAWQELGEAPACPVRVLDLPYVEAPEACYGRWTGIRREQQRPPYRLVVFGYLGRNRRLEEVLEAIGGFPERNQFRLEVCGQLWDEAHIRAQVERMGLAPLVKLLGYLPENLVEQKLSQADLAINLRYPSMGEASASQLQFWDYGLPTLVTRTGWYASLPEDSVKFVRPEQEVEDIQAHLRALLADPGSFREMGERAREALKRHDPGRYVDAMVEFAGTALAFSPCVSALELARRAGQDASHWLHPDASAYLLDRAASAISGMCEERTTKK